MIDPGIRAVFFDAVGTLLFPHAPVSQTYAEFAGRHGAVVTEERVRLGFRAAFLRQEQFDHAAGWATNEDRERSRWRAIVGDVLPVTDADACFADLWAWFSQPAAWTIHPEAGDVLRELCNRGLVVGMASNFDGRLLPLVHAFPELAPVRGRCLISSRVGWRKPSREFFNAVAQSAGWEPNRVLYVGDDLRNDLEGATAAGLQAILINPTGERTSNRIRRLRDLFNE
jgi:putative hydrolase of the HAD superfamily